jgi:multidrug resistance protein, MATE family
VVSAGVLRGVGDTRHPMLLALVGFWVIGMPAGILFTFWLGMGPAGLWWGLALGLGAVGLLLLGRVRSLLAGELARISVEDPHPPSPTQGAPTPLG